MDRDSRWTCGEKEQRSECLAPCERGEKYGNRRKAIGMQVVVIDSLDRSVEDGGCGRHYLRKRKSLGHRKTTLESHGGAGSTALGRTGAELLDLPTRHDFQF